MEGLSYWVSEHMTWVLIGALVLAASLVVSGVRAVYRTGKKLERRLRPWLAFTASLAFLLVGGVLLFGFGSGALRMGPALYWQSQVRGEMAPELAYTALTDGATHTLAEHRGKVVLVNIWATWCPPCRKELPDLDELQKTYRDEGLVVLQISDEDRETVESFLAKAPMTTEHGLVDAQPWPLAGYPTTVLVDREGLIRKSMIGGRTFEQFEREVKKYL